MTAVAPKVDQPVAPARPKPSGTTPKGICLAHADHDGP